MLETIECPMYDTKMHLVVRLQSWSYRECVWLFWLVWIVTTYNEKKLHLKQDKQGISKIQTIFIKQQSVNLDLNVQKFPFTSSKFSKWWKVRD